MKLKELGLAALKQAASDITFNLSDVQTKASKTGNVGYRATTNTGKIISFWDTTMDDTIEELDAEAGIYGIKKGVTITDDGSLIPVGSSSNGFWS